MGLLIHHHQFAKQRLCTGAQPLLCHEIAEYYFTGFYKKNAVLRLVQCKQEEGR